MHLIEQWEDENNMKQAHLQRENVSGQLPQHACSLWYAGPRRDLLIFRGKIEPKPRNISCSAQLYRPVQRSVFQTNVQGLVFLRGCCLGQGGRDDTATAEGGGQTPLERPAPAGPKATLKNRHGKEATLTGNQEALLDKEKQGLGIQSRKGRGGIKTRRKASSLTQLLAAGES